MRELIFLVNLLFFFAFVISTVIETPQNTVIYSGQRLSLKCETINGSSIREWILIRSPDLANVKIYSNWRNISLPPDDSGFGLDVDEFGSGELYSNDTELRHAGKYTCVTEAHHKLIHYHGELNVLESEPVCNVTEYMYGKPTLKVQCFVNFSGNLVPKMDWMRTHMHVTKNDREGSNGSGYTYKLDAVIIDQDRFTLSFRLHFEPRPSTEYAASNIPNFIYVWDFKGSDGKPENGATPGPGDRPVLHSSHPPGFGNQQSDETPKNEDRTLMYAVVALASALIVLMFGTLTYVCCKKHRKLKITDKNPVDIDDETGRERAVSGLYDTIQYDAIGYEIPDHVFSFDGVVRLYETPGKNEYTSDGVPIGYDYPDKECALFGDKQMILSSEYITTSTESDTKNIYDDKEKMLPSEYITTSTDADTKGSSGVLKDDGQSLAVENKYTPLSKVNLKGNDSEKDNISVGQTRSYIEIIDDATDNTATDISKDDKSSHDDISKYTPLSKVDIKPNSGKDSAGKRPPNSYIEIIDDSDGRKSVEETTVDRLSSPNEGGEGNPKGPSASTSYTQLMPETSYTKLVL